MINDNIHPIDPTSFRVPTETEEAISETLKVCGISGEDASMMFIEVMKKLDELMTEIDNQGHSGASYSILCNICDKYHKIGNILREI